MTPAGSTATDASPRTLLVLVLSYPLLTHLAVYFHSLALTAAAALVLGLLVLRAPLQARRWWAWLVLLAGGALLIWLAFSTRRHDALFALYAAPVMVYLMLAWLFGSTLIGGATPLISRLAGHLHGQAHFDDPAVQRYTRRLTAAWTALFLLLAATNTLLASLASPDGVLELLGFASPWPLPPTAWSLFANFIGFVLVALLFALEFAYRRRRFPAQHARYRGLLDFLNHMREEAPNLLRASAGQTAVAGESDAPRMLLTASKRRVVLLVLVAAHVIGPALIVMGAWPWGLGLIVASHLMIVWGTLVPDSSLLTALVRRFSSARNEVWLTIDDGPSDDTGAMLELLDRHAARATFFLVAVRAAARPDCVAEILRRGHSIGNHTASHPSAWFWALLPAAMRRQIGAAQQQLTTLTGAPPRLFRAAVGMSNPFVAPLLAQHGLIRIGWTARGYDSVTSRPETVWARLHRRLRPGAIALLHEGAAHGNSVATLAFVLQQLDALGYRCVLPELPEDGRSATTSQLLNGVPPHSGENRTLSPASTSSAASASRSG